MKSSSAPVGHDPRMRKPSDWPRIEREAGRLASTAVGTLKLDEPAGARHRNIPETLLGLSTLTPATTTRAAPGAVHVKVTPLPRGNFGEFPAVGPPRGFGNVSVRVDCADIRPSLAAYPIVAGGKVEWSILGFTDPFRAANERWIVVRRVSHHGTQQLRLPVRPVQRKVTGIQTEGRNEGYGNTREQIAGP